jgi:hypothetical protein
MKLGIDIHSSYVIGFGSEGLNGKQEKEADKDY